jgi:hypothetical protein
MAFPQGVLRSGVGRQRERVEGGRKELTLLLL